MTARVAAVDCGTNSVRLLIAEIDGEGLHDVAREMRVVRLGEGVDRTGRLAATALARTRAALVDYATQIRAAGASRVRMVATSATRDADNRSDFVMMVRDVLGIDPEVITGREEAALSFRGAASGLEPASGPLLVADIGGGSTELVLGIDGALRTHSMNVGCVRMTERHLHDDPPRPGQIAATVADVRAAIDSARAHVPLDGAPRFVGVAGTVTTIVAIAMGLPRYDAEAINGTRIGVESVREVTARLLGMTRSARAALPVMHPGRVDVIGGGALVLRTLMDEIGLDSVIASEHDILDGIALALSGRVAEPGDVDDAGVVSHDDA